MLTYYKQLLQNWTRIRIACLVVQDIPAFSFKMYLICIRVVHIDCTNYFVDNIHAWKDTGKTNNIF